MRKIFYAIAVVAIGSLVSSAALRSKKSDVAKSIDIFSSVIKEVQTNYVDTVDAQKAVTTAIDAMLGELDPYTEYIPRERQDEFKSATSGEYAGIGSYIMQRNGNVYISGPYEGSPAQLAGLRPGDLIVAIDGDTVLGKTHDIVSERLKGTPGTSVHVTLRRPYVADSIINVDIIRRKISIPSVAHSAIIDDNIGYILLTSFTEKSPDEVKEALAEFKKAPKLDGIILDLRDNGGGFLESAVEILSNFIPKGTEVVRTRGKGILDEKVYKTMQKPILPDVPLVVLTDGGTASASEITAGALQDLDRAVIMGSRSFGKGLVQSTRSVPYDGIVKVTVARYYIPSGRLIQAIDYSHRNPDGTVARIPDSLTNEFRTAAGRIVRDGGGITPDVKVKYPDISRITYNAVSDNWIFDFANRFAATHASIPPAKDFVIDDSIYSAFKESIDPQKFNYDKVCETILNRLREAAKVEGYMSDSLSTRLDEIAAMMKHPLDKDLDTHRDAIAPYIEKEIASRYYFHRGEIESTLRHDPAVGQALKLLANPAEYKAILTPKSTK